MAHQYMPKIFHGSHKNPPAPPPTYLMYGPLEEIEFVKLQWIKVIQKPLYEDNRYEKQLKHSVGIYFDTNHIARYKRRLNKSDLDISPKNPILLPKNEHLTLLIIRDQPNMEVRC